MDGKTCPNQAIGRCGRTTCARELNLNAKMIEHALEALQGGLGIMQATMHEVELEHNVLCKQLGMMQRRIEVLKCQVIHK
jgi:hypothetical protein